MGIVLGGIKHLQSLTRKDDDFVDRLNHRTTMLMLLVFAFLVSEKQFFGPDNISCWVPAHFSDNHEEYTKDYCWVKNTYFIPFSDDLPAEHEHEKRAHIPYYQWMPFILMMQALFFNIPCFVWRGMNGHSGIDLNDFVEKADTMHIVPIDELREKGIGHLAKMLVRFVTNQKMGDKGKCTLSLKSLFTRTICCCCGRSRGNYLYILYLFVKILYVLNIAFQFLFLNWVMGMDYHVYGVQLLDKLAKGDDLMMSGIFPRVTMCDFRVHRLGNVQRYTVQCVLPINLLNEKVYLFLYFWFFFLGILTLGSLIMWITRASPRRSRLEYLKKKVTNGDEEVDEETLATQKQVIKVK